MHNPRLAEKLGTPEENLPKIDEVHKVIGAIFDRIGGFNIVYGEKGVAKMVTNLDFRLQELWGFKPDQKFHTYWYKIPGCKCPKMDNAERVGTGFNLINKTCPYHGEDV